MINRLLLVLFTCVGACAQEPFAQPANNSNPTVQGPVPFVVKFASSLRGLLSQPSPGLIGVTFALYKDQTGGVPLWEETQSVGIDSQMRFTVLLGGTGAGLPPGIFQMGEARWLGIRPDGGQEGPRVLLATVPYAFEAADAQTLGGRFPAEFVTQEQLNDNLRTPVPIRPSPEPCSVNCPPSPTTSTAESYEAMTSTGPSFISNASDGPPLQVGSNSLVQNLNSDLLHGLTDSAFAKVNSSNQFPLSQQFGGGAVFPAIPGDGSGPESSGTQDFQVNGFNSSGGLTSQNFRWQATGFGRSDPQSELNLLFGSGGLAPQATGFSFNSDGTITFAPGQTFPGQALWTAIQPIWQAQGSPGTGSDTGGSGGVGSISQTPSGTQVISQPPGTSLNVNTINNTRNVQASDNWILANIATQLTAGVQATLTLTPCPLGVDTSGNPVLGGPMGGYPIRIIDYAQPNTNSESAYVTGGSCTSAATSGTIVFTPYFSHAAAGYSIGSASSGIQEAINDACGTNTTFWENGNCQVVIPPLGSQSGSSSGYDVYDTIYFHASQSALSGYGATLNCHQRGPCLQVGDLLNSNDYPGDTVKGISFRSANNRQADQAFTGSLITSTQRVAGTITIQTQTPHNFRTGDRVVQMLTDTSNYWGDVPGITVTDTTHYTYPRANTPDLPLQATPGVVALSYEAILDNGNATSLVDIQYANTGNYGAFNHFFDMWDDENAPITNFNNNSANLNQNAYWTGSFIWSGGARNLPNKSQQLAPVITVENSTFTANGSNCATIYNSNGFYFNDSVCQAQGPWEFLISNVNGNYQGAGFSNLYSEAALWLNSTTPVRSPWPGLGAAGLIGGSTAGTYTIEGQGGFDGGLPTVGTGSVTHVYYIVARDLTAGTQTSPMPFMYEQENSPSAVAVQWPRVASGADVIVYDLIRSSASSGTMNVTGGLYVAPYAGGCGGGSASACGSVAVGLPQCSGFVCGFADSTANATVLYNVMPGNFVPNPSFWPGIVVLTSTALQSSGGEFPVTGIAFEGAPTLYADYCSTGGVNVSGGYTVCMGSPRTVDNQPPLMLTDGNVTGGGGVPGAKGRLIFESGTSDPPNFHQIITLYDSNPAKTQATTGHRPVGDPGDMFLGIDPNSYLMVGGGINGIATYVNNIGDGSHWSELLTNTSKVFNVPVQAPTINVSQILLDGSPGAPGQVPVSTANGTIWGTCGNSTQSVPAGGTVPTGLPRQELGEFSIEVLPAQKSPNLSNEGVGTATTERPQPGMSVEYEGLLTSPPLRLLSGTAQLSFGRLENAHCSVRLMHFKGVSQGDPVIPEWPTTLEPNLFGMMRVSAVDTIEIRLCNFSAGALTPSPHTFGAAIPKKEGATSGRK